MLGDRSVGEWRRPVYGRYAGVETVDSIKDIIANHGDISMYKISMHGAGGAADVRTSEMVGKRTGLAERCRRFAFVEWQHNWSQPAATP